jgi:hypothetical protein
VLTLLAAIAAALAPPPPGFHVVAVGPAGGQVWRGAAGPWERYLSAASSLGRPRISPSRTPGRSPACRRAGSARVDIALRHPRLFRRVEAWGGYFSPFHDGPLRHASPAELAAHDPTLLLPAQVGLVRRLGTRFFLSTGPGHGHVTPAQTIRFARLLRTRGLPYRLELLARKRGAWERQLADGLRWAFASGR